LVEVYGRLKEDMDRRFAALEEHLAQRNIDEKAIRSLVKAMVGSEVARVHSVVMEEFDRLKAKVEEELSKRGVDAETIRQVIGEIQSNLLDSVRQIIDQRVLHLAQIIEEKSNDIKDVLDLVNELLKAEMDFQEQLLKLKDEVRLRLNEETLEEVFYKMLTKRGIIKKRRKRWILPIIGGGILAGIVIGLIINPAITFVTIAMMIVVLLRW
jgi:Flp pilus assembly protein TadB